MTITRLQIGDVFIWLVSFWPIVQSLVKQWDALKWLHIFADIIFLLNTCFVFSVSSLSLKEDCFLQNLWGRSAMWPCWTHFSIAMATCSPQHYCFLLWQVIFCGLPASLLLWVSNSSCLSLNVFMWIFVNHLWLNPLCGFQGERWV